MIKGFIDKEKKVPLYLQLKDLIKYYISTGAIQHTQQLPTVNDLAKQLAINFETIRKAYKELEKEGLIWTKRGKGTFVNGQISPRLLVRQSSAAGSNLMGSARTAIRQLLQSGKDVDEVRRMFDEVIREIATQTSRQLVVFAECNLLQITEISQLLRDHLNLPVEAVLVKDLRERVEKLREEDRRLLGVITTGFHVNEVRNLLAHVSVRIDFLVTNMSPEIRRELDAFDKAARYGFICRDQESVAFYKDLLKAELGIKTDIFCSTLDDEAGFKSLLPSLDVILVSPPVFEDVKRLAPLGFPVFNVFDRVDPMSLKVVTERILTAA
jgi:DNA-binding transcriptional regulator YhcF (GntR family)